MYSTLIKRQLTRPSAVRISRLAQASIHEKHFPNVKGNEEFFINTTFPDDYEGSPLKPDLDKKQAATSDQGTTEQHKADIYDSLWGKEAGGVAKETKQKKEATARDEALESEHEPEIDEM
ncbi:hypothetical protein N7533_009476 [Penicillium manginii]|uniref:uncharacterized protein n=1 Tax=Penicillium manginii TaxID=203109 RepID=UPI0025488A60|nr:uncharacterized protein N7533_009476 [Penicillium manginii]KAJ5744606.1 hypothetical protein N7533_009476 [Penicillium manginii]